MHIFIDDLEKSLEKQGQTKLYIGTEKETKEANSLIIKYLQNNFFVKLNNKPITYDFLGKETSNDKQAIWVYLEVKNVKDVKNMFVENKILTETYSDQKNIVQINIPSKKQGYFLLDKNKTSEMASFWKFIDTLLNFNIKSNESVNNADFSLNFVKIYIYDEW